MFTLIVTQEHQVVARVENYDGPVPRRGDYIYHPEQDDYGTSEAYGLAAGVAGCVKQVLFSIYSRPRSGEDHFTGRAVNTVEVVI